MPEITPNIVRALRPDIATNARAVAKQADRWRGKCPEWLALALRIAHERAADTGEPIEGVIARHRR